MGLPFSGRCPLQNLFFHPRLLFPFSLPQSVPLQQLVAVHLDGRQLGRGIDAQAGAAPALEPAHCAEQTLRACCMRHDRVHQQRQLGKLGRALAHGGPKVRGAGLQRQRGGAQHLRPEPAAALPVAEELLLEREELVLAPALARALAGNGDRLLCVRWVQKICTQALATVEKSCSILRLTISKPLSQHGAIRRSSNSAAPHQAQDAFPALLRRSDDARLEPRVQEERKAQVLAVHLLGACVESSSSVQRKRAKLCA
jgi:hypothetical protein